MLEEVNSSESIGLNDYQIRSCFSYFFSTPVNGYDIFSPNTLNCAVISLKTKAPAFRVDPNKWIRKETEFLDFLRTAVPPLDTASRRSLKIPVTHTRGSLGRVCKLTMDPRHSSIRLFRKAASELLCKHALGFEASLE
jgi:hypothetical protein